MLYNVEVNRYLSGPARWVADGCSEPKRDPVLIQDDGKWNERHPVMFSAVGWTKGQARRRLYRLAKQVLG